jgi:FkbM family methyltransferase
MTMVSYGQNREDVLLDRLFPRGVAGFYIDIGAHDPVFDSVTKHFYDLGWRGVNVEPATEPFTRLDAARARDVNLNCGISDHEGTITFFEAPASLGVSTLSADQARIHIEAGIPMTERTVEVTTLAKVCEEHVDQPVDFLTIDVEGHERQVLLGADWERWRPRVVVIEATEPGVTRPTHEAWEDVILDAGYVFATFDGLNRFYVRAEDKELAAALSAPANVFDDYIPYEYHRQIRELRAQAELLERRAAASHVATEALRSALTGLSDHLRLIRSQYANLETAVAALKDQCREAKAILADTQSRCEQLRTDVIGARIEAAAAHSVFDEVGAEGIAVARRITRLSHRFPRLGSAAKRSLRGSLRVTRTARDRLR